jgi:RNA polymerase sigma-70 factor (ECF subfamily)
VSTDTNTQAGFLALLTAHRRLLYKVTRAYGHSAADRDDLAQEAIVQLWRAFPRYDPRFKFSTWMYRITLNVAISWRRRERTQMQHRVPDGEEILENVEALDAALDRDDVALLYASIERFDEFDRALLLLYLDGHSHAEIAEVLGMTPTNVGTRIARLREQLRKAFREAGHLASSLPEGEPA